MAAATLPGSEVPAAAFSFCFFCPSSNAPVYPGGGLPSFLFLRAMNARHSFLVWLGLPQCQHPVNLLESPAEAAGDERLLDVLLSLPSGLPRGGRRSEMAAEIVARISCKKICRIWSDGSRERLVPATQDLFPVLAVHVGQPLVVEPRELAVNKRNHLCESVNMFVSHDFVFGFIR